MGNCHGSSYEDAITSAITRSLSSSSAGPSGPITATRVFSQSTHSDSSGVNSLFSLAASGSLIGEEEDLKSGEILRTPNLRIFSFSELKYAAKGFKPQTVLGEGGFGRVYQGWIDDKSTPSPKNVAKIVVAIKKLNSEGVQGFEQWQSEVNFLGSVSHPNLVNLLGYCWEDKELLLVYEYMQKGSLENHLFRRSVEVLSWDRRLSIALGAARGLAFLHTLDRQIIYRDFKASNVLLDGNFNAKLSDFGLAKFGPSGEHSHVTTRIMGTQGYAAPEYVATGRLYVKSDVYGFGVVLLEILTGLRAIDPDRPVGQRNLVEFTRNILSSKRKLSTIMDRRIDGQYPFKAALETAQLTQKCLKHDPRTRPSMTEVVETLQLIKALTDRSRQAQRTGSSSLKSEAGGSHGRVPLKAQNDLRLIKREEYESRKKVRRQNLNSHVVACE